MHVSLHFTHTVSLIQLVVFSINCIGRRHFDTLTSSGWIQSSWRKWPTICACVITCAQLTMKRFLAPKVVVCWRLRTSNNAEKIKFSPNMTTERKQRAIGHKSQLGFYTVFQWMLMKNLTSPLFYHLAQSLCEVWLMRKKSSLSTLCYRRWK